MQKSTTTVEKVVRNNVIMAKWCMDEVISNANEGLKITKKSPKYHDLQKRISNATFHVSRNMAALSVLNL
jgi:hypothetical protein